MWTLRRKIALLAGLAVAILTLAALLLSADEFRGDGAAYVALRTRSSHPLGVLGDSDSHSYQDLVSFPRSSGKRGGVHRDATLQWTEVLARLRPADIDPGEWGVWGVSRAVARAQQWFGLGSRAPRKQDFRFNFAMSGAGCESLTSGGGRQVQRLLAQMAREPQRWQRGFVVIRIGVNDFGMEDGLDLFARDPMGVAAQGRVGRCLAQVRQAVALLHEAHPATRIVLVGIFDNSHWPRYQDRWRSRIERENVERGLTSYDAGLASIARADPRIAYFDDRAWFAARWGGRDASGAPAYRAVALASGFSVSNTIGDDPANAVVLDGHAGLVWNALWAQSMVDLVDQRFGMGIPRIGDVELSTFVEQMRSAGPQR